MSRATFTRRIKPLMAQRGWKYGKIRLNELFFEEDTDILKGTNYYDYNNVFKDRTNPQRSFYKD